MLRTLKDLLNSLTEASSNTSPQDQEHQLQLATAVLLVEVLRAEPTLDAAERATVVTALRNKFSLNDNEIAALIELAQDTAHTAYDYFIEFGHQANEFTLKELKPKSSLVGAKKLATLASQFALRYLLPVGLIGGISYGFAPQYLVHSLSIALVLCIVQLVLSLKSSKQKGTGRMDLALRDCIETMMRDFQNNAQQISQEQAIIDSWDDEKTA